MGHPKGFGKVAVDSTAQISDPGWKAPRLSKALLEAPVGGYDCFRTDLDRVVLADPKKKVKLGTPGDLEKDLKPLLDHLEQRLKGSLDEAWISPHGYNFPDYAATLAKANKSPLSQEDVDAITAEANDFVDAVVFYNSPEERWARAISEMLVFQMYGGLGQSYGYGLNDEPLLSTFPTVYAVAVACQHVSDYCILSRGVLLKELQKNGNTGCSCAGGVNTYDAFDKTKSKKKPMKKRSNMQDYKAQQAELKGFGNAGKNVGAPGWANAKDLIGFGITPGSVVTFNPGGYDYNSQDIPNSVGTNHSAPVLRMSGARLQFIDTGPLVGDDEAGTGEAGTVDHSFVSGTIPCADTAVSVGVLRDCQGTLVEFAEKTAAARPLGFIRLVITETSTKNVLFVSKLVHMRWQVSKLIWSLRGLPTDGLTVTWLVYLTTTRTWSDALVADGTTAPSTLLAGKGILQLTNVLTSDGKDINVYRYHDSGTWRRNFSGNADASPGDAAGWTIESDASTKVLNWCLTKDSFGKRFIRQPGEQKGETNDGASGSPLVDP
jgi:hypothetical protein